MVGLTTAKPSPLECQLGEAGRERDRQEADAASKLPVWWSHETPCHARQHRRTEHSYIICIPPCASQAFPLIKRSRVHCTQLCIIHQAFLSMEHVFIIHTRQHFKLTCKMPLPKLHPLIGHCRQFHHRQQQGHGTPDCRRICITSWPCPKM